MRVFFKRTNLTALMPVVLGAFLSMPLAIQAIPFLGVAFFALSPILFLIAISLKWKGTWECIVKDHLIIVIFLITATFYYGMAIAPLDTTYAIWKDAFRGLIILLQAVIIVQLSLHYESDFTINLVKWFRYSVLVIATTAAIIGLLKYGAILMGNCLEVLYQDCALAPWGTSVIGDYNFYALSLLIGGLVALRNWYVSIPVKNSFFWALTASTIFQVGYLSGSRRFAIFAPLLILIYIIICKIKNPIPFKISNWKALLGGVVISLGLIQTAYSSLESSSYGERNKIKQSNRQLITSTQRILDIHKGEIAIMTPRLDRWRAALESGTTWEKILGTGFSYRYTFGCRFQRCGLEDWPHAPVLSAILYGGIFALIATILCFALAITTSIQILVRNWVNSDLALGLLATVVFVSISGDSLLSMPVFFSMLVVSRASHDFHR